MKELRRRLQIKTDVGFVNANSNGSVDVDYILHFDKEENATIDSAAEVLKNSDAGKGLLEALGVNSSSVKVFGKYPHCREKNTLGLVAQKLRYQGA